MCIERVALRKDHRADLAASSPYFEWERRIRKQSKRKQWEDFLQKGTKDMKEDAKKNY